MTTTITETDTENKIDSLSSNHQTRVYDDIFEMLPDEDNPTPMVKINKLNPSDKFTLLAKLEWFNPFGSVKDRAAWSMLSALEKEGEITNKRGMVEPTSGNTGISLAGMASAREHPMRAVVPNAVPLEKKLLLKIAGAQLDVLNDALCPAPGMGDGSVNMARTHAKAQPDKYMMPNQYENEHNLEAHIRTTGPEIWKQSEGKVTHLFVSLGTCGTAVGTGRYLKEKNPDVKIVAVQPTEGHDVPGIRGAGELEVSKFFDPDLIDDILEIDFELAYKNALELIRKEGLRAGPSSGLILEGAKKIIERDYKNKPTSEKNSDSAKGETRGDKMGVGVMIFPDDIFKYTSNMAKHMPDLLEGTSA